MSERALAMSGEEVFAYMEEIFPAVRGEFTLLELEPMRVRVRLNVGPSHIRPGGTVSGPSMFALADCAFYLAIMGLIGKEALTVTTNCSINFLNKPPAADLICEARLLKLGKLLATGDAMITSVEDDRPMAHASLTYAIPPKR